MFYTGFDPFLEYRKAVECNIIHNIILQTSMSVFDGKSGSIFPFSIMVSYCTDCESAQDCDEQNPKTTKNNIIKNLQNLIINSPSKTNFYFFINSIRTYLANPG